MQTPAAYYTQTRKEIWGTNSNDKTKRLKVIFIAVYLVIKAMDNFYGTRVTYQLNFMSISGETSAGKSSMLNLILGEELLPFSVLSTTSTICELKYGRERRIKIHYKEAGKEPKVKYLDESSPYMDQISEFVHVKSPTLREKASDYSKVELFWPQKFLQVREFYNFYSFTFA